jgi:adenylylsulfate kinase
VQILNSDDLLSGLTPRSTCSREEREWLYHILVRIAQRLTVNGFNFLISATGSQCAYREDTRRRIKRCSIVHLDCPPEICRERERKGYRKGQTRVRSIAFPTIGLAMKRLSRRRSKCKRIVRKKWDQPCSCCIHW